ncbi:uncharacterized protein G2W53_013579 [Senna tora]|uniref:Uncharacterized protein n=1 Tax=Senna tora TaxID=362788 RepID=A0A834WS92_9FABA|nr:uncharacterized protein G2W53_013579 [Senna tora]
MDEKRKSTLQIKKKVTLPCDFGDERVNKLDGNKEDGEGATSTARDGRQTDSDGGSRVSKRHLQRNGVL